MLQNIATNVTNWRPKAFFREVEIQGSAECFLFCRKQTIKTTINTRWRQHAMIFAMTKPKLGTETGKAEARNKTLKAEQYFGLKRYASDLRA